MGAGAVVLDEVLLPGAVGLGKTADEAHGRALPRVDVLVVVSDREQVQSRVVLGERPAGERRDQFVLGPADVLVLVDQNPVEASQHLLPRDRCGGLVASQQPRGVAEDVGEGLVAGVRGGLREGDPEDPHGERMAGHRVDTACIAADQLLETPPRLHRRVAVVRERQDAPRVLAPHPDEVGDTVHQHPGLARPGPGQDQHVGALAVVGDDALLRAVAELRDDPVAVVGERVAPKRPFLVLEPLADELAPGEPEVVVRQTMRQPDVGQSEPGVLGDHVDLRGLLGVVRLQRLEVGDGEASPLACDPQGHGRAEDRQAAIERDDLLLVHPQQRTVHQRLRILIVQLRGERQVVLDGLFEGAVRGLDQEIDPARAVGDLPDQVPEEPRRALAPQRRDAVDGGPVPTQPDPDGLHVAGADLEAALRIGFVAAVGGQAPEEAHQPLGQRIVDLLVAEPLREGAQGDALPGVDLLIGRRLAKLGDERLLEFADPLQAPRRGVFHPGMDVRGDPHVVGRDPEFLERAEHLPQLRGPASAFVHQLVGGHAGVRVRRRQDPHHAQHPLADIRPDGPPVTLALDARAGGRDVRDPEGRREHGREVLVAAGEPGFLQPGDGGAHPVVVGDAVAREIAGVVLQQDLARRGDHRVLRVPVVAAAALVETAERPQHRLDVAPLEARAGRERELLLGVAGLEQQQALRAPAVPARAPGLLQVALQRAGYLRVHDRADVRLVDAHAEGVGGDHHVDVARVEAALDLPLPLGRDPGVEVPGHEAALGERLGGLLRAPLGRAVDDGAARVAAVQRAGHRLVDVLDALRGRRRDHGEFEIGALGAAVDDLEPRRQRPLEVRADVLDDVVLGGRGQAQDRRRATAVMLGDETRDVAVVGAEVVPPLGEAVRLVDHPGADVAARDRLPERPVAELLGRDQHDPRVAEPDRVERLAAFRHRDEAVDGGGAGDALPAHHRHLVGHQRHQGRDHHGEGAGGLVAHQRRKLVAQRLAGPGGQDAEHVGAGQVALGDGPLQAPAVPALRLLPEVRKPEPALQCLRRIQAIGAPGTASVAAVRVPEPRGEPAGLEAFLHVGRDDGLAPRRRQPRQQVGQREGLRERLAGDPGRLVRAAAVREAARDQGDRVLDARRGIDAADDPEQPVETVSSEGRGKQRVPGQQQVAVLPLQRVDDVGQQLERELSIEQRIVDLHARKRGLLVLLDQVVVRVLRERQGAQVERVDRGQVEQREVRRLRGEETEIVLDDVVSDEERRAVGEGVESGKRRPRPGGVPAPRVAGFAIEVDRADRMDAVRSLEVERQQARKAMGLEAHRNLAAIVPVHVCHRRGRSAAAGGKAGSGCVRVLRTRVTAANCLGEHVRQVMASVWHARVPSASACRQDAGPATGPAGSAAGAAGDGLRCSSSPQRRDARPRPAGGRTGRSRGPEGSTLCGPQWSMEHRKKPARRIMGRGRPGCEMARAQTGAAGGGARQGRRIRDAYRPQDRFRGRHRR